VFCLSIGGGGISSLRKSLMVFQPAVTAIMIVPSPVAMPPIFPTDQPSAVSFLLITNYVKLF